VFLTFLYHVICFLPTHATPRGGAYRQPVVEALCLLPDFRVPREQWKTNSAVLDFLLFHNCRVNAATLCFGECTVPYAWIRAPSKKVDRIFGTERRYCCSILHSGREPAFPRFSIFSIFSQILYLPLVSGRPTFCRVLAVPGSSRLARLQQRPASCPSCPTDMNRETLNQR
jgi:hypothetical protein